MAYNNMRQWVTNTDGLENLQTRIAPVPEPGYNEVLVKVHTVSLNYRDTEVCMGLYSHHKAASKTCGLVPCSDMCGTIVKLGEGASRRWKEGQRVLSIFNQVHLTGQIIERDMASGLGLPLPGVLCEYRAFPDTGLLLVPDYLTDEEAACLPIAAVTAWMSINWNNPIDNHTTRRGTSVLLQGTGGVCIAGLQIAHACGLTVIVTSSSDDKLDRARKLGADHTINYHTTPEWAEQVLELTYGRGADIIFETGGAGTLRQSFDCVAYGGNIACIGYLAGKEDPPGDRINTNVLALKRNATLKGMLNGPADRFEEMLRFYTQEEIHPTIDKVFPFEQAKEGLQYLFSGGHFGKVVIRVA